MAIFGVFPGIPHFRPFLVKNGFFGVFPEIRDFGSPGTAGALPRGRPGPGACDPGRALGQGLQYVRGDLWSNSEVIQNKRKSDEESLDLATSYYLMLKARSGQE